MTTVTADLALLLGAAKRSDELQAENERLRTALEALLDWLGPLHDRGEQVGNLDMALVEQARAALGETKGTRNELT